MQLPCFFDFGARNDIPATEFFHCAVRIGIQRGDLAGDTYLCTRSKGVRRYFT